MSLKQLVKKKIVRVEKEKVLIPVQKGNALVGRLALITGGASGIGYAIAEAFLDNGASVIITGRNAEKLELAKNKLSKKSNAGVDSVTITKLDISNIQDMESGFERIVNATTKPIDIFVNNAGVNGREVFPNVSEAEYDQIMDTNLKGTFFFSQMALEYMKKNNIKGNLLNIASSSALRPAITPYMLSKWAIKGLTAGLAKKYYKSGIVVNGLAPGNTATAMIKAGDDNDLSCDYTPTGRYLAPEEVGNLAVMLVSDMGKMIIGDIVYATGGSGIVTFDDMNY